MTPLGRRSSLLKIEGFIRLNGLKNLIAFGDCLVVSEIKKRNSKTFNIIEKIED